MNRRLPHFYLKNPSGQVEKFNKSRNIDNSNFVEKEPEAYRIHKENLGISFTQLFQNRLQRLEAKTLVRANIEIIEIRFLIPFSDGANFNTRTRFLNEFGLSPVIQRDFNRTVLFAIIDDGKFANFSNLLNLYIQSDNQVSPKNTEYAIITTLHSLKFHTTNDIQNYCSGDLVFEFINNNQNIHGNFEIQRAILNTYLESLVFLGDLETFTFDPYDKMVQIRGAERGTVKLLAENFDILAQAHTLRSARVKPDQFNNARLTWDLIIHQNPNSNIVVGILDNGIRPIDPIQNIVFNGGRDISNTNNPLTASHQHGTVVASLAAVGDRYFNGESELTADTNVYSIKILENIDGYIDIIKIVETIREIHQTQGLRLFNLSICSQSKNYNESPSLFAYLLDKLAYDLDILIFIAAGNMNYDDLTAMQQEPHTLHTYPNHFYNPEEQTDIHSCTYTNICTPAESMNHITVGALADNYREETSTHLSLDKKLPAYYSRKNHYDFKQKINGGTLSNNYGNKNLFKPDIVMPGGDLLNNDSAMQVLGFGENGNDFYLFDSGTSLATPLALNLAVQLLNSYPHISLQSVKALLLNSADSYSDSYLHNIVERRKDVICLALHGCSFSEASSSQKREISKQLLSSKDIHRNLVGYGKPDREKLIFSSDQQVSLLIEDIIQSDHHKVFLVHVPEYLLENTRSNCLKIQATLCFKINPVWGNHVDYNPLHISFNFANSVVKDSIDELADILADRNHEYYRQHWTEDILRLQEKKDRGSITETELKELASKKLEIKNKIIGVKNTIAAWSEDFFPLVNKPLSNRQQLEINLEKKDISKIENQLVIVMRCTVKENLDPEMKEWARTNQQHAFSLAIRIEDKTRIEGRSLYDELQVVNNLEVIQNNLIETDLDLDLEN